jgi:hypothetical protein
MPIRKDRDDLSHTIAQELKEHYPSYTMSPRTVGIMLSMIEECIFQRVKQKVVYPNERIVDFPEMKIIIRRKKKKPRK